MRRREDRLARLEAHLDMAINRVGWHDVDAALARLEARTRLKVCQALGVPDDDPLMLATRTLLAGDDAAQVQQDQETIMKWRRQEGITPNTDGDVCARLDAKFDDISRRLAER